MSKENPYAKMQLDELVAENQLLMREKAAIRERQLLINAAITERTNEMVLAREMKRIAGLLGKDTQDISPEGIASQESVGEASA